MGCAPPLRRAFAVSSLIILGVVGVSLRDRQGALRGSLRAAFRHIKVISLKASCPFSSQPPTVICKEKGEMNELEKKK